VSERSKVDEVARRVAKRHDALHLLVNNAGIPGRGSFFEVEPEQIEAVARTNYLGSVWCTRAFLPLLEAGAPSDLVNVVSVAGLVPSGASGPYSSSKHAQLAFSRAVAPELRQRGVRVHTVCPGPVETPGFSQRRLLERPLTARLVIDPDEVAAAILRTIERGRAEAVVPSFLRIAGILQGLAPATLARLTARLRTPR
jgi:short-subunit dehydrogenase